MDREIPDFLIEQLLLGELREEQERELLRIPKVVERLERLKRSNEEILSLYKPEAMAEKIQSSLIKTEATPEIPKEKPQEKGRIIPFFKTWRGGSLLAAAAVLILFGILPLVTGNISQETVTTPDTVRTKGYAPVLRIYKEVSGNAQILFPGDRVKERDLLQISYLPGEEGYGVIFSIDGRGIVTLHYPFSEGASSELQGNGEQLLPYAYQLDDAPGFERFFFITSSTPIPVNSVLSEARKLARDTKAAMQKSLSLSSDYTQYSILLKKE